MKTVFFVLPRRISIRYILSTGSLEILKHLSDLRIVILTSVSDPKFIAEFSSHNITIEPIPMRDGKEFWLERIVRRIRNYLGGMSYDLATFNSKALVKGKLFWLFYRLLVLLVKPFAFLLAALRWFDARVLSYFLDGDYERQFEKYRPDLVVIHSIYELTAVPVARVAKRKRIPSVGIVLSWDNLTNKGEMYARCDKLIVWSRFMKEEAVKYHNFPVHKVFPVGTPQFDCYVNWSERMVGKEKFFLKKGLSLDKKLLVYTTIPQRIGGEYNRIIVQNIYNAIHNRQLENCQLLVRIYTKDDPSKYTCFENLDGLILDKPADTYEAEGKKQGGYSYRQRDERFMLDLAETIKYADVIINIGSTITIDAAILDRPVVNVAFGHLKWYYLNTHYQNLVKTGGVKIAQNEGQLLRYIKEYLANPHMDALGRSNIVKDVCGGVDGHSGERIAHIVAEELRAF